MMTKMTESTSRTVVDQSQVNEQLRKAILDKKQAQIEAWSVQIERLQQGLQEVASNVGHDTQQRVADLTAARDRAKDQLDRLQKATQESWTSILQQSDEVFQDLAGRVHAFVQEQTFAQDQS